MVDLLNTMVLEIDPEVDFDSRRAVYFRQMRYGLFVCAVTVSSPCTETPFSRFGWHCSQVLWLSFRLKERDTGGKLWVKKLSPIAPFSRFGWRCSKYLWLFGTLVKYDLKSYRQCMADNIPDISIVLSTTVDKTLNRLHSSD